MHDFSSAFAEAFRLIVRLDPDLGEIVWLSMRVSFASTCCAALLGLPLGA